MDDRKICITEFDMQRLRSLIVDEMRKDQRGNEYLTQLDNELSRSNLTAPTEIPADVITMNSRVRILDMENNEEMVYTLVFPSDADLKNGKLSVLAPIGTALLGYRQGDIFNWKVPGGTMKIKVLEILYQPEASGDFNL